MVKRKHALLILFLIPLFICMVSDEEHDSSNSSQFLGKCINFVILFGGLTYVLYKPIRSFLQKRSTDIERSLKEAEEARKEAEKKLNEVKLQLEKIEDEIDIIKKQAAIDGEKEKEEILARAQEDGKRLKKIAKAQIDMYVTIGLRELKEFTAEMATKLARERIKKKLTPQDQSLLIDKSINKLSN